MPRTAPTTQHFDRRVDGIEYGILDTLVGYAIRRAQIAIYEDFDRALAGLDVTPQRFAALVLVGENPGIPQHLLGRVLGIARSGVVQIVHGFVERGWAVRATDGADATFEATHADRRRTRAPCARASARTRARPPRQPHARRHRACAPDRDARSPRPARARSRDADR